MPDARNPYGTSGPVGQQTPFGYYSLPTTPDLSRGDPGQSDRGMSPAGTASQRNQGFWKTANDLIQVGDPSTWRTDLRAPGGIVNRDAVRYDPVHGWVTPRINVRGTFENESLWHQYGPATAAVIIATFTGGMLGPAAAGAVEGGEALGGGAAGTGAFDMGLTDTGLLGATSGTSTALPGLEPMISDTLSPLVDLGTGPVGTTPSLGASLVGDTPAGAAVPGGGGGTPGGGYTLEPNMPPMAGPGGGESMGYSDLTFPSQTGGDLPYGTEAPNDYGNFTGSPTDYSGGPSLWDTISSRLPGLLNALPAVASGFAAPGAPRGNTGSAGGRAVEGIQIPARKVELETNPYAKPPKTQIKSLGEYLRGG